MTTLFNQDVLDGEVALVTGASRGIGASIAATLAAAGARVIGTATSQGGADAISAALGDKGRGLVLNIADDDSVQAAIKDIQGNEPCRYCIITVRAWDLHTWLLETRDSISGATPRNSSPSRPS